MDVFFYEDGDGNDVITDYSSSLDKVIILSPNIAIGNPETSSSGNVTFKIGDGQITFQDSASKYIELVNEGGTILSKYNPGK